MSDSLTQSPQTDVEATTPRRRRWPRVLGSLFVLLLLGVWFAPTLVAKTSLLNRVAHTAGADLNGTLDIGNATLGWLSNVELRDITLTDPQGRVVVRVPKVTLSRTLLSLVRNQSDLGEVVISNPVVEIVCENDTTNLEDVLRKLLTDSDTPPGPTRTPLALRVVDGILILRDTGTSRFTEFQDVGVQVNIPASRSEPLTLKVAANTPQRLELDASLGHNSRVSVATGGFAMEALSPFLRRFGPGLSVAGALTADVTATWSTGLASLDGMVGVKNLSVAAPALNGDTLRLASADLPMNVRLTGNTLQVDRAELTCDVGTAKVVGTFDPESFDKLADRPGVKIDASVDVAKLATVLPRLLQIRQGTEVREGKLTVAVESKAGPDGTAWSGTVNTSALKAIREGKEIRWDEPLAVEFTGRVKTGQIPTFDKLICKSDFIAINARVSSDLARDSIRAAANVYLDRLAVRLGEFVDLQGVTLDGQAYATLVASRVPTGEFKAETAVELKQFALLDSKGKGLREPAMQLHLITSGNAPANGSVVISTATLVSTAVSPAGTDELDLTLLEPITDTKQLSSGKLDARVTGDLGRWKNRVAAVVPVLNGYTMGGKAAARGVLRFATDSMHIDQLSLAIQNARFVGAGLDIDEPTMNAVANLTVDNKSGTTTFDNFTINSAPLSVTRGKLVIESPKGGQTVVYGGGPAVTDLNRLGKTLGIHNKATDPAVMFGKGTGPIQFRYAGDVTTFNGHLDVVNFVLGPRTDPAWAEPTMALDVDGSYTQSTDTVAFKAAKVERPGLAVAVAGSIGKFDTTTDASLTGTITYDFAKLSPKLREELGAGFSIQGKGSNPMNFVGSLTPPAKPGSKLPPSRFVNATGDFAIGWDSMQTHGFTMGQGTLQAKLANGVVRFLPISGNFGGGKISIHPTVNLEPPPGNLTLARGWIVDKAKLTPAVCAEALGYALPAIAKSSKAEGEISVMLAENSIPLVGARQATVKGNVVIHKATVSGGPVVTEIAKLLGADSGTMTLSNEQTVPVRVERGRVYHENLNVKVGGYIVKTTGSVGFDNTVDLVADVPIPGGMPGFKNAPALAKALTGKRVLVPIKGTLEKPSLDPKQFQAAIAKLAESVAKDVGKDVIQKELNKLLPGFTTPGNTSGFFPFPLPKK